MSNSRPPSTALLWLALVQIGAMLFVASWVRTILRRQALWALVIAGNQVIMTLFLWHVTALVSCIGLAWLLGGIGLNLVPGSLAWWLARVPWILAAGLSTLVFIALFSRVERRARPTGQVHSVVEQIAGAIVTCGGVVFLALGGIISSDSRGIAVLPLLSFAIGIGLVVHATTGRLKSGISGG